MVQRLGAISFKGSLLPKTGGISAGALVGTLPRGFSMWLLGLLGWVPWTNIQRRREGAMEQSGTAVRVRGRAASCDLASEAIPFHFCHILFIRSLSLRLTHIQREGNLTLLSARRNVKDYFGCFKNILYGFPGSSPEDSDSKCLGGGPVDCIFNKYPRFREVKEALEVEEMNL